MNKILRYSFVALLAMIMGSAWADDVTFTAGTDKGTNGTSGKPDTMTKDGITISGTSLATTTEQYRIYANSKLTISSTVGNITKVVFNCTGSGDGSNGPGKIKPVDGYSYDAQIGTWQGSASSVEFETSAQVRATSIVVTVGAASSKKITSIEFSGNYLTKFTQGKDGQDAVLPTANVKAGDAAVEGATVTWTLTKGSNWSADSDPAINETEKKIVFGEHSCGDLTVKASYAGNDTYEASTKSYTLKLYKGYMSIKSILEDYPVVGGDSWKGKEAEWKAGYPISYWQVEAKSQTEFTSKEALVTYVNGQYTYIKDDNGCLLLYGSNLGFKKGDKISGDFGHEQGYGAIYGTLKAYNGLLELATTKNDVEFVVKSSDNAVEAKTITVDQLTQENMNEYLKIQNAEYVSANGKNLTFKVGDANFAVYNQFNVKVDVLEAGAKYDLYGMGCIYYKDNVLTPQLYLVEFEKTGEAGINEMKVNTKFEGKIYNLAGQVVNKGYKGLVIMNGRKVVMK